jgi:hypothetical protein
MHRIPSALFALAAAVLLAPGAAGAVTFSPAPGSPFPAGDGAQSVVVGDFNEDGKLDAVTANQIAKTATVFLGDGHGGFSSTSSFGLAGEPFGVVAGDFDGDHHLDLAFAELTSSGALEVQLGNGGGSFVAGPGSPYSLDKGPNGIAMGDFNEDESLDIALSSAADEVIVLLNKDDGSGGFNAGTDYALAASSHPRGLVVTTVDVGSHLDIVTVNGGNHAVSPSISALLGNGSGGFGSPPSYTALPYPAESLAALDVNGDAKQDVVVPSCCGSTLPTFAGDGLGGFSGAPGSPFAAGGNARTLAAGDVNGDGKPDVIAGNLDHLVNGKLAGDVSVLLGDGAGAIAPAPGSPYGVGPHPFSVALGDFDGDGRPDIVTANHLGDNGTPGDDTTGSLSLLLDSPPDTSISGGPSGSTRSTSASFDFASPDTTSAFECRLDAGAWTACNSPKVYSGLGNGTHTLDVRATNEVGKTDPTPATKSWTVDLTTPPSAALDAAPNPVVTGDLTTFDASRSSDPLDGSIVDYQWDLDGDGIYELDTGGASSTTHAYASRQIAHPAVRVTNDAGTSATASVDLDVRLAPPPGDLGVSINGGDRYTDDPHVTVSPVWPALATSLRIANDGGFADAQTVAVDDEIPWTLDSTSPERLPQTIYVRFVGGPSGPEIYQDDIVLDQTPPQLLAARVARVRARNYTVVLHAKDAVSGLRFVQAAARRGHHGVKLPFKRTLHVRTVDRPHWVRVRDRAGNWSRWHRLAQPRHR